MVPYIGSASIIVVTHKPAAYPLYNTTGVTQEAIMPVSPSSRGSDDRRGRSRGRDNAIGVTYDDMTAISGVHPDPLTRMTDDALNDAITDQEQLCMTKVNDAQRTRTVLTAMLVERRSRGEESDNSPSRSNSPPSVEDCAVHHQGWPQSGCSSRTD